MPPICPVTPASLQMVQQPSVGQLFLKRYRATVQLPAGEKGCQMLRDRMVQRTFPCAVRPVCARTHNERRLLQNPVAAVSDRREPLSRPCSGGL
jgi:hypothetical protein